MTILLFWTAVGVLTMAFTARKAFGAAPLETTTSLGYGLNPSKTTWEVDHSLRRWFRVAFFAGLLMFLTAGSLAALAKDMG